VYTAIVGVKLAAMETRQRFVGSQHQKYSHQTEESFRDDEKRHSPRAL